MILFDDEMPGFGLRIREGGSRTFIVQYKIGTQHRRTTLGSIFKVSADDARKQAKRIFGKVVDGTDPANDRAERVAAASTGFESTVDDFLKVIATQVKPRTLVETTRYLKKTWKPLHPLALASITRATVAAEARKIADRSGPIAADRARSALSRFFSWCIGEGLCESNPVVGTNKAAPEATRRARVLSDGEVVSIWNATDPATDIGKIVRLLFTTACRRSEIGGLRVAEIVLTPGDSLIALPGSRTKNGLPHDAPLSGLARGVVESIETEGRTFAFGTRDSGFSGWSKAKAELDDALSINEPWTFHDIRRTVATRMGDLGVQPHIVEAVLNHVSGSKAGVAGTYNRAAYAKEKRAALDTWASHLKTLLAGAGNVRRLKRA